MWCDQTKSFAIFQNLVFIEMNFFDEIDEFPVNKNKKKQFMVEWVRKLIKLINKKNKICFSCVKSLSQICISLHNFKININ